MAAARARLALVRAALADFPASVAPEVYREPPRLVPLGALVSPAQLRGEAPIEGAVLAKFVRRLKAARPELDEAALLALEVPAAAGDQEVYLARLGKWRFELDQLRRQLD